jgi:hypothetical protein
MVSVVPPDQEERVSNFVSLHDAVEALKLYPTVPSCPVHFHLSSGRHRPVRCRHCLHLRSTCRAPTSHCLRRLLENHTFTGRIRHGGFLQLKIFLAVLRRKTPSQSNTPGLQLSVKKLTICHQWRYMTQCTFQTLGAMIRTRGAPALAPRRVGHCLRFGRGRSVLRLRSRPNQSVKIPQFPTHRRKAQTRLRVCFGMSSPPLLLGVPGMICRTRVQTLSLRANQRLRRMHRVRLLQGCRGRLRGAVVTMSRCGSPLMSICACCARPLSQ